MHMTRFVLLDHNPYVLNCTTAADCTNYFHDCLNADRGFGTDPNGWACVCWFVGNQNCTTNFDCCSNICQNGKCMDGGGRDGALCMGNSGNIQPCAPDCQCIPFENAGYCKC